MTPAVLQCFCVDLTSLWLVNRSVTDNLLCCIQGSTYIYDIRQPANKTHHYHGTHIDTEHVYITSNHYDIFFCIYLMLYIL